MSNTTTTTTAAATTKFSFFLYSFVVIFRRKYKTSTLDSRWTYIIIKDVCVCVCVLLMYVTVNFCILSVFLSLSLR